MKNHLGTAPQTVADRPPLAPSRPRRRGAQKAAARARGSRGQGHELPRALSARLAGKIRRGQLTGGLCRQRLPTPRPKLPRAKAVKYAEMLLALSVLSGSSSPPDGGDACRVTATGLPLELETRTHAARLCYLPRRRRDHGHEPSLVLRSRRLSRHGQHPQRAHHHRRERLQRR